MTSHDAGTYGGSRRTWVYTNVRRITQPGYLNRGMRGHLERKHAIMLLQMQIDMLELEQEAIFYRRKK